MLGGALLLVALLVRGGGTLARAVAIQPQTGLGPGAWGFWPAGPVAGHALRHFTAT